MRYFSIEKPIIENLLKTAIDEHYSKIILDDILFYRTVKFIFNLSVLFQPNTIEYIVKYVVETYISRYTEYQDDCFYTIRTMMASANISLYIAERSNMYLADKQMLFVAAMFQDLDHTNGSECDSYNVSRAIIGYRHKVEFGSMFASMVQNVVDYNTIISDAIFCTVIPTRMRSDFIIEQILVDSNFLLHLLPDIDKLVYGMNNESEYQYTKESLSDTFVRQGYYTDIAKKLAADNTILYF